MAPPSPSPHRRAPLFRPPELPLPSALVPPKKRRVMRTPPKATTPIPPPPPPVPAAAGDLAVPAPTPPPRADPVGSPPAADQKPTLPPPPRAATKPSLPPPPTAENPSSPPPLTTEKPSSLPPPPAAEDENPSEPPLPATEKPSSPPTPPTDAPAYRAPTRKVRKVVRKVSPKGTIATREAAAAGAASAAAGALQPGEGHAQDKPPTDRNAAEDEVVGAEQSLGETAIKEPAAGCNSIAVGEAQLVKEMVTDCGDAPVVEKLVSRGEGKDEAGMSEWQRRRKTEVFVGGLNRDAKEEDVRAVLAEAGEIAEVRMIMDSMTKKNKGYCFVRYHEAAQARKAIAKFGNVKVVLHPLG
ncbi:formin-like protein 16 [Setaria italica]|uniref:formin-like protein 16 n=1 Tax=Setaria italica TaxID=4555 RepID=UPI000BE54A3C|nr:formin-like protein 16 [Setaria italica]